MSDNPLDRWEASIEAGKSAEAAILITFFQHLGMSCVDNTLVNVKNPDLRGESPSMSRFSNPRTPHPLPRLDLVQRNTSRWTTPM